jgi:ABC-2 type transport system permease protein
VKRTLSYLWALFSANVKSYAPDAKRVAMMSFFMIVQNTMFFALWIILFGTVRELKGWSFEEVARMYGFVASAIGISLFFFNGSRTIAYRIQEGTLDGFIARPRAVLPALLMSSSSPASLGDVLYGPLIWLVFCHVSMAEFLALSFLAVNAALLFTAMSVMVFSLAFWTKGSPRFGDQLFEMIVILSANMTHGQPLLVRLAVFTILPAGFINFLPVEIMRDFNLLYLLAVLGATLLYGWLAVQVFRAGLRKYVSGHCG